MDLSEWSDALPDAGFEPFHTATALEVLDRHTAGELRLYGGFKGDRPVALLPVFVRERGVGRLVFSPPPSYSASQLGPVVMPASPKRSKREKVIREFADAVLETVDARSSRTLFRMECSHFYSDPRPYVWEGLDLDTKFTYRVDFESMSPEELRRSFSKSLRREIRDAEELDVDVRTEGIDGARAVYHDTRARYEEQGRGFPESWEYVRDLVSGMDRRSRVYVARDPSGEFIGGITVLYSNDAAYFWQGGARAVHEGVAVNGLLHWRIIEDAIEGRPLPSVGAYDLMGANTERLCRYKRKFAPDLVPYYVVETGGAHVDFAKRAYQLVTR